VQDKINKKIESYLEYAVELQTELTARQAISPVSGGEGEYDKAIWLEEHLKAMKFDEVFRVDIPDEKAKNGIRPSVFAKYHGKDTSKTLWIMTHIDVVPAGDLSMWKTDPFKVHREGNKIYGRGVEDNQQGMVASILCAKAMMELDYRPPFNLGLLIAADEENGSDFGAAPLMKNHLELFGKDDMFIVPDIGNSTGTCVEIAEKSIMWLKFITKGKQCHASTPDAGINSFRAGSALALKLGDLYKKFNKKDKLFDPKRSTFEPTKKEANVPNVNTIPGEDIFYLDCRVLPDYNLDDVQKEIRKIADTIEQKYKVKITVEPTHVQPAAPMTMPDSEIVKIVSKGIKKIGKIKGKVKPCGVGGGTVAAFFRNAGFDVVAYSKVDETMHGPNEYCILDNLILDAKIFAYTAMNIDSQK
jgi:succinyl-diaminopimelate desuccinylase